jgi:hypothetical protein
MVNSILKYSIQVKGLDDACPLGPESDDYGTIPVPANRQGGSACPQSAEL